MSGPKQSKTLDLEEATNLHRDAIYAVLVDMAKFVIRRRQFYQAKSRAACRSGHIDRSDYYAAHAIAFQEAQDKLAELRKKHGETSARSSCIGHQRYSSDGPSPLMADPTPEEIAEECAKFQAGWTESERERRGAGAPDPVEVRPLKVDHLFR